MLIGFATKTAAARWTFNQVLNIEIQGYVYALVNLSALVNTSATSWAFFDNQHLARGGYFGVKRVHGCWTIPTLQWGSDGCLLMGIQRHCNDWNPLFNQDSPIIAHFIVHLIPTIDHLSIESHGDDNARRRKAVQTTEGLTCGYWDYLVVKKPSKWFGFSTVFSTNPLSIHLAFLGSQEGK